MTPGPRSRASRPFSFLLAGLVFLVALAVLSQQARTLDYDVDEGQKIAAADYFRLVFLDHDLFGPAWEERYWTLTHPPMIRYILGAAIWVSGNPIPAVNLDHRIGEVRDPTRARYWDRRTYLDRDDLDRGRRVDRPSRPILAAARAATVLFGAGAVVLAFLLGRSLSSSVAGLLAAAGLLATPAVLEIVPRAYAEGPLLFFLLLGLYLGIWATRRALTPALGRAAMAGIWAGAATGLAAATKLTGLLGLAAFAGFGVWSILSRRWHAAAVAGRAGRWAGLAALCGLVTFVLVNPFLWPGPIARTQAMLEFRRQEMFGQRITSAKRAVPESVSTRAELLLQRTFVLEPPLARYTGAPVELALALVGGAALLTRSLRSRVAGGLVGSEAFFVAWFAVFLVGTAPNLEIDWQRYYLPTVALALILAGVGADVLIRAVCRAAASRAPARPLPVLEEQRQP